MVPVPVSRLGRVPELPWGLGFRPVEPVWLPVRRLKRVLELPSGPRLGRPSGGRSVEGRCRVAPGPATGRAVLRVPPLGRFRSVVGPWPRLSAAQLAHPKWGRRVLWARALVPWVMDRRRLRSGPVSLAARGLVRP
ncbi:hypothetical protein Kisp01_25550 [Kineosporia sp. NBRC 101677]|nr:hypothetical protein Kisp01_25550 [Kineosporia sp. NBRC 101677]